MKTNTPAPTNAHLRTVPCGCGWRTTVNTETTAPATCACCGEPLTPVAVTVKRRPVLEHPYVSELP